MDRASQRGDSTRDPGASAPVAGTTVVALALAEWKDRYGWSDERIARATGLDRTTVAALRLGRQNPQPRTLGALIDNLPDFRQHFEAFEDA